jgi:glutathione S-transferase
MIVFYRHKDCRGCDTLEEALKELCIAYKPVTEPAEKELPAGSKLPAVADEGRVIEGSKAIVAYLEEMTGYAELWRKFQSDVCYCDED